SIPCAIDEKQVADMMLCKKRSSAHCGGRTSGFASARSSYRMDQVSEHSVEQSGTAHCGSGAKEHGEVGIDPGRGPHHYTNNTAAGSTFVVPTQRFGAERDNCVPLHDESTPTFDGTAPDHGGENLMKNTGNLLQNNTEGLDVAVARVSGTLSADHATTEQQGKGSLQQTLSGPPIGVAAGAIFRDTDSAPTAVDSNDNFSDAEQAPGTTSVPPSSQTALLKQLFADEEDPAGFGYTPNNVGANQNNRGNNFKNCYGFAPPNEQEDYLQARFREEITMMKSLDHPSICKLYDVVEDDFSIFLVMEYCDGGELNDKIDDDSLLPEHESLQIVKQVAQGLRYCHEQNIVHRDIKPENILFKSSKSASNYQQKSYAGDHESSYVTREDRMLHNNISKNGVVPNPMKKEQDNFVKLIDFGIASWNNSLTNEFRVGTYAYVSPEVLDTQHRDLDHKVDIWALGVVMYVMLSGLMPFAGP
ncbi:unnamed protein product, partial [Amoebophrya sp. A120]